MMKKFQPKRILSCVAACGLLVFAIDSNAATNPLYTGPAGTSTATTAAPNYRSVTPAKSDRSRAPTPISVSNKVDISPPQNLSDLGTMPPCPNSPADFPAGNRRSDIKPPICPDINNTWPSSAQRSYQMLTGSTGYSERSESITFNTSTTGSGFLDILLYLGGSTPTAFMTQSYKARYCPDQCYVNRYVAKDGFGKVVYMRDAVCPDGYAQVATFNAQSEYAITPTDMVAPFPISTLSKYNEYIDRGYTCSAVDTNKYSIESRCIDHNDSAFSTYKERVSQRSNGYDQPGPITTNTSGYVGQYVPEGNSGFCYTAGCLSTIHGSPGGNCELFWYPAIWLNYVFKYTRCSVPAGSYYGTGRDVAVGLICSRIAPAWSNEDKATGVTAQ